MATMAGGDERVIAAAQQIVKNLGKSKNVTDDMILILSSFDNRLSTITDFLSPGHANGGRIPTDAAARLAAAEKVILRWGPASSGPIRSEDSSPDEVAEYLGAVDVLISLTDDRRTPMKEEVLGRAEVALQMAMSWLEDEFHSIIIRNTVSLNAESLNSSINSLSASFESDSSRTFAYDDDQDFRSEERSGSGFLLEKLNTGFFCPEAVSQLKEIADRMIRSNYGKECSCVYGNIRREILEECLVILGVRSISPEEVQRVEWTVLDDKAIKWVQAVRVVIRVLLSREKQVCEQIFGASELVRDACFASIAERCLLQLLSFAEAIAGGQRTPERLFRILDMFDALTDVMPDLRALLLPEDGERGEDMIYREAEGVLRCLIDAARGSFSEFESQVRKEFSQKPILGCEVHPSATYLMNYVTLLVDYSESLNALLEENETKIKMDEEADDSLEDLDSSPFARRLHSLISYMEHNLNENPKLHDDVAMHQVFLMNNAVYVLRKVRGSKLEVLLGDQWVRKRIGQVRQYSMVYFRNSWGNSVLFHLKDEGIGCPKVPASVAKVVKERFRNFNLAFEETCKLQTAWKVADPQLREELRLFVSEKVIAAYRSFLGRFASHLEDHASKYIKYSPDDLENRLVELFEGVTH